MEDLAADPSECGHGTGGLFEAPEADSKRREKAMLPIPHTAANLPMCSGRARSLCSTKEV